MCQVGLEEKTPIFCIKFVDISRIMIIIYPCMDTHKSKMAAGCDLLAKIRDRKVVVGAKQLKKALLNGRATQVFLARNADPALTEPIEALCQQNQIESVWVPSMTDLGHACGIDVGAAAAAVID